MERDAKAGMSSDGASCNTNTSALWQERVFLASLPSEVRAELGLVCKCCGGCKTGQSRATRSARGERSGAETENLVGALQRSEQHMLHQASEAECSPNLY